MSKLLNPVELVLKCASWQEAQRIADVLLKKRLVKTVETMDVGSKHWWRHRLGQGYQISLILNTVDSKVVAVKKEINNLRHGEKYPPYLIPVARLSTEVTRWVRAVTEVKSVKLKK
jgi:uncharacterized protein involved in tolerance to divalent cations